MHPLIVLVNDKDPMWASNGQWSKPVSCLFLKWSCMLRWGQRSLQISWSAFNDIFHVRKTNRICQFCPHNSGFISKRRLHVRGELIKYANFCRNYAIKYNKRISALKTTILIKVAFSCKNICKCVSSNSLLYEMQMWIDLSQTQN